MMQSEVCLLVLCSLLCLTDAVNVNNVSCSDQATVNDLRISGCTQQPCTIRKGEPLPFELDLSFATPAESSSVYFNVFIPKFAVPPAAHGSSLVSATCEDGNLGFACPVSAGERYTIKSTLVIDPKAVCTGNCEEMGENGTGLRDTKWRWAISEKRRRGEAPSKKSFSSCSFRVMLNIVE